jgi:hypothetical protein
MHLKMTEALGTVNMLGGTTSMVMVDIRPKVSLPSYSTISPGNYGYQWYEGYAMSV